ncbi:hypothetical protein FOZ62_028915, partial [Perkinsus olseni]
MVASTYEFLRSAPKVELHVHLDAAFDTSLLYEVARRDLSVLPEEEPAPWRDGTVRVREQVAACQNLDDFTRIVTMRAEDVVAGRLDRGCRGAGLACMLDCFAIFLPIVRGKKDVLEEMAYRFCRDQAQQNIIYTEVRYNPHILSKEKSSLPTPRSVTVAITAGLRRGMEEFGIDVKQILCCMNRNPEMSADIADLAIEFKGSGVVGVDVASGELHFDQADVRAAHVEACRRAKSAGLHVTIHAAEDGPGENFCCAVTKYFAERIGHGYRIHDSVLVDSELYQRAKATGAHIEACPTSSICTEAVCLPQVHPEKPILDSLDWSQHPIK